MLDKERQRRYILFKKGVFVLFSIKGVEMKQLSQSNFEPILSATSSVRRTMYLLKPFEAIVKNFKVVSKLLLSIVQLF